MRITQKSNKSLRNELCNNTEIWKEPLSRVLEPIIPRRKQLSYWWAPMPTWYDTKNKSDEAVAAAERLRTWRGKIAQIESAFNRKDPKETFKLINRMTNVKGQKPPVKALIVDDETVQDPDSLNQIAADYFREKLHDPGDYKIPAFEAVNPNFFTPEEVVSAIKACQFNKGVGPDMFDGNLLLDEKVLANYMQLFDRALNYN